MRDNTQIPLFLFAKAPIPGLVKTRMQPELQLGSCAALAKKMLLQSVQKVIGHWPGKMVLCVSPEVGQSEFERVTGLDTCEVAEQVGGNLGDRMLHALKSGIDVAGSAVVMGCDVPHITADVLIRTHKEMCQGHNIIGPAEDGGFYLIGLSEYRPEIFHKVDWGTDSVMSQVDRQAIRCGLQLSRLPSMRDIDRWQDLVWLAEQDARYASFVVPGCPV